MIRSNLSIILAENNLKITKVSHDTGISRTTLTALSQNNCKGIQFDTLNTLCMYLNVTPSQIIDFVPIEIYGIEVHSTNNFGNVLIISDISFYLKHGLRDEYYCSFAASFDSSRFDNTEVFFLTLSKASDLETEKALKIIQQLPRPFFLDISELLATEVAVQIMGNRIFEKKCEFNTEWSVLKK